MAGFAIAVIAFGIPFLLGVARLGRPRIVLGVGGVVAVAWLVSLLRRPPVETKAVPLWFVCGLVVLLYAIWCGGLWLGLRLRRMRHAAPG